MNALTREAVTDMVKKAALSRRLQRELRFVPEEITDWEDRDFLVVANRARSEGIVIAPLDRLYVAPFRLRKRPGNSLGRVEPIICDLCASWQSGPNSAVISFDKDRSSVSYLCCADLLCSLHVRDKTSQAQRSRVQLRENLSTAQRTMRLQNRLEAILSDLGGTSV